MEEKILAVYKERDIAIAASLNTLRQTCSDELNKKAILDEFKTRI